jgi:glycosyltransferase involved in cell wall biosynthesis
MSLEVTPGLSVVVPVFNSHATLPELVGGLLRPLGVIAANYELLLVNDGSDDPSWSTITRLAAENSHVHGIDLARNFGQHNALLAGIRAARHEVLVTVDDDFQHPPGEIARLVERLSDGFDVVYGAPVARNCSRLRSFAGQLGRLPFRRVMPAEIAKRVSPFRAFRTRLRDDSAEDTSVHISIDALLARATDRFTYVEVLHPPSPFASRYNLRRLVKVGLAVTRETARRGSHRAASRGAPYVVRRVTGSPETLAPAAAVAARQSPSGADTTGG